MSFEDYKRHAMASHRFFIPAENFSGDKVSLPADTRQQMANVLRLKPGDQVELLDNCGLSYLAALEKDGSGAWTGRVLSSSRLETEPSVHLTLYFGLTRREKLEWILQKGTEIGVTAFQPFISTRTLLRDAEGAEKKRPRWEVIVREAAEQSGRAIIPLLGKPLKFTQGLQKSLLEDNLSLACRVHDNQSGFDEALAGAKPARVGLFTGPEGGFAPEEADQMLAAGVRMVSLGKRVLRMETAAILAPALVLYALGEMGADLK